MLEDNPEDVVFALSLFIEFLNQRLETDRQDNDGTIVKSPEDIVPACPMPESGSEPDNDKSEDSRYFLSEVLKELLAQLA